MRIEVLVSMANNIGAFFRSEPDPAAAARGVLGHFKRFWDPRMRREIVAHYQQGGEGLDEPARTAVGLLASEQRGGSRPADARQTAG